MASAKIPDPLVRRHLIEKELAPAQALKVAEAYLAEGRSVEAVEFLQKAAATEQLTQLRSEAVGAGDVFLFRAVAVAMADPPQREEWVEVAQNAESAGNLLYAAEARRLIEVGGI